MCWFQIWHWFSKMLSPNPQIWAFWIKKYQLSNLNEILPVPYSEGANFKSSIGFWKFWAQMPKFWHFVPKSINFLILAKFRIYHISNVLISNLTLVFENFKHKFPNMGILGQKESSFTRTLIQRSWFEIWHLSSKISSPNPQI